MIDYYQIIKRNEDPTHATKWMDPKNNVLAKRNHSQKTTHYINCPECANHNNLK